MWAEGCEGGCLYVKLCSANGTVAQFGGLSDDALSLSDTVSQLFSPEVENALLGVQFIAQHIRDNDKDNEVIRSNFMGGKY